MNYFRTLLAMVGSAAFLLACAQPCDDGGTGFIPSDQAEFVDKSLITQEPCAPPCWYGIIPGQTTRSEMREIVDQLPFVNLDAYNHFEAATEWNDIFEQNITSYSFSGRITVDSDGIVSGIDITRMRYQVTLQEIIDLYGEPDGVNWYAYGNPDLAISPICADISIYWFGEGLIIDAPDIELEANREWTTPPLTPDMLVRGVSYLAPVEDLGEYIEKHGNEYTREHFTIWTGFDE